MSLVRAIPEVKSVISMRTMHRGSEDAIIGIEVDLSAGLDTGKVETVINTIEQ